MSSSNRAVPPSATPETSLSKEDYVVNDAIVQKSNQNWFEENYPHLAKLKLRNHFLDGWSERYSSKGMLERFFGALPEALEKEFKTNQNQELFVEFDLFFKLNCIYISDTPPDVKDEIEALKKTAQYKYSANVMHERLTCMNQKLEKERRNS